MKTNYKQLGITAKQAIESNKTFYAKHWQTNNYYPIDKFVYNAEKTLTSILSLKLITALLIGVQEVSPLRTEQEKRITQLTRNGGNIFLSIIATYYPLRK